MRPSRFAAGRLSDMTLPELTNAMEESIRIASSETAPEESDVPRDSVVFDLLAALCRDDGIPPAEAKYHVPCIIGRQLLPVMTMATANNFGCLDERTAARIQNCFEAEYDLGNPFSRRALERYAGLPEEAALGDKIVYHKDHVLGCLNAVGLLISPVLGLWGDLLEQPNEGSGVAAIFREFWQEFLANKGKQASQDTLLAKTIRRVQWSFRVALDLSEQQRERAATFIEQTAGAVEDPFLASEIGWRCTGQTSDSLRLPEIELCEPPIRESLDRTRDTVPAV